jgi:threonine dehydrogenase-like Zn-dependent dehydrogenase
MEAITVRPGEKGSARVEDVPEPAASQGALLVDAIALGVCGTDREIAGGEYGEAPDGEERLVLGHESLGRVADAPAGTAFSSGDLVVGIVRRPDPVPCRCCAAGEFDMCLNGEYRERGIKGLHGYGSERFRLEPEYAVPVPDELEPVAMLLEPTSVVAKAWEQIERISSRACSETSRVLVTGAGPIGLLGALLGVQRRCDVHVLDRVQDGLKPELVRALGATYHSGGLDDAGEFDIVIEATGVGQLVFDVMLHTCPVGIVCLTGVSSTGRKLSVDPGELNNELVLENNVVFGSVNANRRHYEQARDALLAADRSWLERLVTNRVPLGEWQAALAPSGDDVKAVVEFG